MKKKGNTKTLIFYILLIAVILFSVGQLLGTGSSEKLTYSKMVELFKEEKVKSFEIDETNNITIQTNSKDGNKSYSYRLRSLELFHKDLSETIEQQREDGIIKNYNYAEPTNIPWWVSMLPYVLLIGLFVVFWIFMAVLLKQQL